MARMSLRQPLSRTRRARRGAAGWRGARRCRRVSTRRRPNPRRSRSRRRRRSASGSPRARGSTRAVRLPPAGGRHRQLRDAHAASREQAERTLDVQYFVLQQDDTGQLLLGALLAAADRGVRVRLLLDDALGIDGGAEDPAARCAPQHRDPRLQSVRGAAGARRSCAASSTCCRPAASTTGCTTSSSSATTPSP